MVDNYNHELVFSYQGDELMVEVDESILQYILNNLLLNAIKYSPQNSTVQLLLDYQEECLIFQVSVSNFRLN